MWKLMLAALVAALSLSAQVTVFQHADVIDGSGGPVVKDATLVVAQGKIRQLTAGGEAEVPQGAEIVDLSGKTVIPGIINLHGHVRNDQGFGSGRGPLHPRERGCESADVRSLRCHDDNEHGGRILI